MTDAPAAMATAPRRRVRGRRAPGRGGGARWRLAGLAGIAIAGLALAATTDLGDRVGRLQDAVGRLGAWGPVAFVAIYLAATLLAVPGTPFTVAAPLIFGPWAGFAVMVVATTLSASTAFLAARYLARDALARALEGREGFARLERLVDAHAWVIIPFVRVVPVPFALNNYGFGLTSVGFWRYLAWSEVGMVPMNALVVFGADSLLGAASRRPAWPQLALAAAAAAVAAALALAGRRAWAGAARRR